jgi:hypothetical protein
MSLLDTASLIVTPNGYKEGKLYSVIPSDGSGDMSVVRATTATRVNSAGLVELVPYNLLTWSEDFTNGAWTKQSSTITSNATTAPNGTLSADKIIETAVNDAHLTVQSKSISASVITASVFLKKSELQYAVVFISNTINKNFAVLFDVNNGTVVTNFTSIPSYAAPTSSSIEDMGNGWYRCTITATDSFTNADLVIALNKSGTDSGFSYVGDGTSGLFLWGAQLNEGSLKDYQKTETRLNIPRLDYSNGTCPSLLLEPQRTNLVLYSSSFDNAAWLKFNSTISTNTTTSPDGTQNADSLVSDSGLYGVLYIGAQFTAGQNVTLSIFAKANTSSTIRLGTTDAGIDYGAVFNLSNGTITSSTGVTASIQSMGNGWYRCIVNRTMAGNANIFAVEQEGNKSLYIWGVQGELGSYATSYIPTTSASVTRNADVISKTGISSLIGQTEGTFFVDIIFGQQLSPNWFFSLIGTDWITNSFYIERASNGLISVIAVKNGSGIGEATSSVTAINGQRAKIAVQYASSQFNIFVNGTKYIGTISAIPTCNDIYINQIGTLGSSNNHLQKNEFNAVALWKTALTDAQCQTLTTI